MIKNPRIRRTLAAIMVILGAVLMFLAPAVWQGALVLAAGVALELLGIALKQK